jgi:hypothetical protein
VPEAGQQRSFSFEHAGQRHNIALDGAPAPFEPPRPITRLLWGAYLFVPSLTSIAWLEARALAARGRRLPRPLWSVERGDREIARLQALALAQGADAARLGWKQTLEDAQAQQEFLSASVWAAIRHHHGGALRTPYGVLVAGADLVDEVLGDDTRFSVRGYRQRMVASGMDIYLGLDGHDPRYAALADRVNAEIGRIGFADTFQRARDTARAKLDLMVSLEKMSALSVGAPAWELNLDAQEIIEHTLAELCDAWCGMLVAAPLPGRPGAAPTLDRFARGGWRWSWQAGQASICPAHFNAPSRYFFQPDPGAASQDMGRTGALAAVTGMTAVVARHRAPGAPAAPAFMAGVLAALAAESDAVVGRTLAGVLMGFLPPADGNLRLVLNEWLRDGTFWRLRSLSRPAMPAAAVDDLLRPELLRALQVRCSPDMLWRTVVRANDQIGGQALQADEVVVVSLISQAQEKLEQDQDAPYAVFGGNRRPGRHPTHACPGYQAAMGAMLGVLAALLSTPQTMRPSPAALSFTLTGNVP